jgi:catechol 2,3-dioxygenase
MTTQRLDVEHLLAELPEPAAEPFDGLAGGTVMGHVHLRVAEVPRSVGFFRDVLGFALMATFGAQAAFLSAGGYHHHVGANSWESAGRGQPPPGSATLVRATVVLPSPDDVGRAAAAVARAGAEPEALDDGAGVLVRDPSGNPLALVAAAAA